MDAQCGNTKYSHIENIRELNSSHTSPYTGVLEDDRTVLAPYTGVLEDDRTVLVTLLRCIVNCKAYPIQELCGLFPQKQELGLKGLGWRF